MTEIEELKQLLFGKNPPRYPGDTGVIGELIRRTTAMQKLLIAIVTLLATTTFAFISSLVILILNLVAQKHT